MITMNGKYQTRDGRAVRILCTDGPGDYYPVVGVIEGQKHTDSWTVNGIMSKCNAFPMDNLDLIPVPTKHEAWTILEKRHVVFYSDKSTAQETIAREDPLHPCFLAFVIWED